MSMSTEEALKYMSQPETPASAEEVKDDVSSTPTETETAKSEETSAKAPEEKVGQDSQGDPSNQGDRGSDEPQVIKDKDENKAPEDKSPKKDGDKNLSKTTETASQTDKVNFAFVRQKEKYKAAKARIAEQQKEIEKLRKEIESTKDLQLRHFKKEDGSQDVESYMNFRDRQRDMESKIESMTRASEEQQRAMDLEIDSELTKRCFTDPTEREEYERMKDTTGPVLFQILEEKDPNHVILNYLDTLNEYPVVLRELLQPQKNGAMIARLFRSTDPQSLHRAIADLSDKILDDFHNGKSTPQSQVQVDTPKGNKTIPILGKQISGSQSQPSGTGSLLTDMASMNDYLRTHPRGR